MKKKSVYKRITYIVIALVLVVSSCYLIPAVLATTNYPGFVVGDEVSIYLIGSDAQYDTLVLSVDTLLALYQGNSPDCKLIQKNYAVNEKQGQIYAENEVTLSAQIQEYLALKEQADLDGDLALVAYYQNLYDQTLVQKGSLAYEKERNQFIIDNQEILKQNDILKTKGDFAAQVYSLISLQYQLNYYNKVFEYQHTIILAQKVKLDKEKIMRSEYDLALAEAAKTNADILAIQTSIQSTANYIRLQTGIAKTQDIAIKIDVKKIKNLLITTFNSVVDAIWQNNLDEERLAQEITSKTNQKNSLLTIYPENSNQGQLYFLEIEILGLEKSRLTLKIEQEKLEQKNRYAMLKVSYDVAVSRANELSKIAYEKSTLYDLGMETKIEKLNAEMNRDGAIYELYNLIQQLLGASFMG